MQTVLLVYDIPERSEARNPSARLRRLGVRVNLSCWVLPEELVPHHLLNELLALGASWHCVRFADSEGEHLVKLAIGALTKEVQDLTASLERSAAGASAALEANDDLTPEARLKLFRRRTKAAIARTRRLLADARQAAQAFRISEEDLPIAEAVRRVKAVRSVAESRAHLYVEAARRLAEATLKAAAEQDQVPAYAMADALEEQGEDVLAFREAFSG